MENLSPQNQQDVVRLQQLSQNIETLTQQRISMEAQVKESEFAIKELEESGEEAVVYQSIGGIFIKSPQPKVLSATKERKETMDLRIASLKKQEERLKKQHQEMDQKVREMLKSKGLA